MVSLFLAWWEVRCVFLRSGDDILIRRILFDIGVPYCRRPSSFRTSNIDSTVPEASVRLSSSYLLSSVGLPIPYFITSPLVMVKREILRCSFPESNLHQATAIPPISVFFRICAALMSLWHALFVIGQLQLSLPLGFDLNGARKLLARSIRY